MIHDLGIENVFRYVDDYLIVLNKAGFEKTGGDVRERMLHVFENSCKGLKFTKQDADANGSIRFLDLRLEFGGNHVCWEFEPRSRKALLSFNSVHFKLVKRGM